MIPGISNVAIAGVLRPPNVTALSFLTTATAQAISITIPGAAAVNDVAILGNVTISSGSVVVPSGWTTLKTNSSSELRLTISCKVLDSGDLGASITGMGGTYAMLIVRPNARVNAVGTGAWNGQITSGNPSSQLVTASNAVSPAIVFAQIICRSGSLPLEFSTVSPSLTQFAFGYGRFAYRIYDDNPVNHTVDIVDLGFENGMQSGYLTVA